MAETASNTPIFSASSLSDPNSLVGNKIRHFQSQFAKVPGLVHLNNAGLSLTSVPARSVVQQWIQRFSEEGMHCDQAQMQATQSARIDLAKVVGCEASELAFFQSTASAISQIAFGLGLVRGDEVLVWDQEYSSNLYPWKAACVEAEAVLKLVKSEGLLQTPVENLIAAMTDRTKAVGISWVQYQTGSVTDLVALSKECRRREIFLSVDVIQGLGLMPFDFQTLDIDAVCGGSHKWMVSPLGVGFLALQKQWHQRFKPRSVGALTYGTCDDPSQLECAPKVDATRFEPGSKQVLEIFALAASARLLVETEVSNVQIYVEWLSKTLVNGLQEMGLTIYSHVSDLRQGREWHGSIVNFGLGQAKSSFVPAEQRDQRMLTVAEALARNKISFIWRGPGLRLSPHAFNSPEDIEFTLDVIRKALLKN